MIRNTLAVLLVFTLASVVAACHTTIEDEPRDGVLLSGDADTPAIEATYDLSILPDLNPDFISTQVQDGREVAFLRTELTIAFEGDATVGQVNETLRRIDARIMDMVPEHLDLVVEVDDPGNMEAVQELIADVEASEHVIEAMASEMLSTPAELESRNQPLIPDGFENSSGSLERIDRIDHHLAVRAHAAWNARSAIVPLDERPWLVVPDYFGEGAPGEMFNVVVEEPNEFAEEDDWNIGDPNRHGYHVLGIATGYFDQVPGESDTRDDVTGIFPEKLRLRAVDMERLLTSARYVNRSGARIKAILDQDPNARIVLSSSIGETWSGRGRARGWTRTVRGVADANQQGAGDENNFIHFTSAGNAEKLDDGGYERWDAKDNGPFAYAALGDMSKFFGRDYPNLTNIHVVENRRNTTGPPPLVGCVSQSSIVGGTLSAIGADVYSMGACTDTDDDDRCVEYTGQGSASSISGTSMATPQAAGLAAFMWSVNPDLSVSELKALIKETAHWSAAMESRATSCHPDNGEPVIDALAAVLAAGGDAVRTAILDVDDNGVFDEDDVAEFAAEYTAAMSTLKYSRYDLTGDGVTGTGIHGSMRFDLDGSQEYAIVEQSVAQPAGASTTTLDYDEEAASDWDVLCYYAYSDLYAGDPSLRDNLVSARCSGAVANVTVTDNFGIPLSGVPLEVTRNGAYTSHHVEDLGGGDYQIWVRPSVDNYQIEVPSGYAIAGDTTIGSVERYEVVDGLTLQLTSAPGASLDLLAPIDGRTLREESQVAVKVLVETPSDTATVHVEVNGDEMASRVLDERGQHELELVIDGICPLGTAEIAVIFEDGFDNYARESVQVEVVEAPLTVEMAGAEIVEIAWEDAPDGGSDPHWYVPDITLQGAASKPSCERPAHRQLDQSELKWWKPKPRPSQLIGQGPTLDLDDAFFRDADNNHIKRDVGLSYEYNGELARAHRALIPCYGEIHIIHDLTGGLTFGDVIGSANISYPEGPVPEADYPACVTHETTRNPIQTPYDLLADLERIQTQLEAEALLGDLFDDLLTDLDPPGLFPGDPGQMLESGGVHWGMPLSRYVFNRMGGMLYETTYDRLQEDLGMLLAEAREELSQPDFIFLTMVVEEVSYHAMMFSPVDEGGANAWKHLGYVQNADELASTRQVDPLAPARGALAAFSEAAFITADYGGYPEASLDSSFEAGVYGAMSAAIGEVEAMHHQP